MIDLLCRWKAGDITAREVHEFAEMLWEAHDSSSAPETADQSIVEEALLQLEALPATWVIVDDIPAFLKFLETPAGEAQAGWQRWKDYWKAIDLEERRRRLAKDPYYSLG